MYQYTARFQHLLGTAGLTRRRLLLLGGIALFLGLTLALLTPLRVS
jgi:hypothetical protein